MQDDPLVRKCEELLDALHANSEHAKLRRLIGDIEALRARLLAARDDRSKEPA
jgi:hypothetical protein